MLRQSNSHIEQPDVIWYEPFNSEQEVRRNGGTPLYTYFTQSMAHFTQDFAPSNPTIVYDKYDGDMALAGDITFVMRFKPEDFGVGCENSCRIVVKRKIEINQKIKEQSIKLDSLIIKKKQQIEKK